MDVPDAYARAVPRCYRNVAIGLEASIDAGFTVFIVRLEWS